MEYKVGDVLPVLGGFVVSDVRRGGFGIVYIGYRREKKGVLAVKSFQDKYFFREDKIADAVVGDFRREAEVWLKLERHENIVEAFFLSLLDYKPHIFMEYVDGGSLRESLVQGRLSVPESLFFGIQSCDGMMYANSVDLGGGRRGIVHRDIKPENLMLTGDRVLKIMDFGLVKALGGADVEGIVAGTPPYMSPEQFETADVDTRSDVYSLGAVLYEMLTGEVPFKGPGFAHQHVHEDPVPPRSLDPSIPGELEEIALKCLEKRPGDRYRGFEALRDDLADVYESRFGHIPEVQKAIRKVTVARLATRGLSLAGLGRHEEAMELYDRALEMDPGRALTWSWKGASLTSLGRWRDSLTCYERALEMNPREIGAWMGKGASLVAFGRHQEAIECFDRVLEINPRNPSALSYRGMALWRTGKHKEAIPFFDRALEIDPRQYAALLGKGLSAARLARHEEAKECFDRALEINPRSALAWASKGASLAALGRHGEAVTCFDRTLEINPRMALAWASKGASLAKLGRHREAKECVRKAVEMDPRFRRFSAYYLGGGPVFDG